MRTTIAIATFLVVGAGAAGAGALDNISLLGSDTLFEVTNDVLAACPGATGLTYLGTGSGAGEGKLKTGAQSVAPMSRFLQASNTCAVTGAAGDPTAAEGTVVGLDGIAIVGSVANAGTAACNGSTADCNAATEPNTGVAFSTTITLTDGTSYTFTSWRDVLRVLYAGMDHAAGSDITKRNCNSALRATVVSNWSTFFQSQCSGGTCTSIRHAWRRDDSSGTTDAFLSLIGLPSASVPTNSSPLCNAAQSTDVLPANVNRLPADFQDNDPIRVKCAGTNNGTVPPTGVATEQVCGRTGDLGVVLPIYPTDFLAAADAFPTNACTTNTIFGIAPKVIAGGGTSAGTGRCPNGDIPVFINQCLVPVDVNGNTNCLASKSSKPAFVFDNTPVNGVAPAAADGRVYNLNLYKSNGTYWTDTKSPPRQISGAFYRIHSTRTMNLPDTSVGACQNRDATSQIGCLVQADPCSVGFAGKEAAQQPGAVALKVKALEPTVSCIQSFAYPITRKLYFNTMLGFANVTGQERALSLCESTPSIINAALSAHGFVQLPAGGPNAGQPFCEDFNEQMLCGAASNTNACASNPSGIATAATTCGNGVVEAFEECDLGAAGNGSLPATCSTTCRFNN
jgi:ABC-type phosphate transport system substrate-binding protein